MTINTQTVKVKCDTCGHSYKVFLVNIKVNNCKNCPNGKVTKE